MMNILVVDVDELQARALARQLVLLGYGVNVAKSYAQAVSQMQSSSFDAVLCALNLGFREPRGPDLLELVRSQSPTTKRVLIAGAPPELLDPSLAVFLQRPIRMSLLLDILAGSVAHPALVAGGRR